MRPERDELDRFQNRKDGSKSKPIKANHAAQSARPSPASGGHSKPVFLSFMVVVLLVACGALGWAYMNQEARVSELKEELDDAIGFVSQSKLLMARLEGELSQTGEELEQSGSAAQKKLAFLDSEMRKLWGVSNDRNKKAIKTNADDLAKLETALSKTNKSYSAQFKQLEQGQKSFESILLNVQSELKSLTSQSSLVSGELAIIRESVNEDLDAMRSDLKAIKALSKGLAGDLDTNKQSIAAIDSNRKQLNERVIALDRKVNALQLELKTLAQPASAPKSAAGTP